MHTHAARRTGTVRRSRPRHSHHISANPLPVSRAHTPRGPCAAPAVDVVAAQPSRLWGGRPLLRVTTRSGFSELFTLNGRGYCRNSSSFRSKPPLVEPKDSSPYQGRTINHLHSFTPAASDRPRGISRVSRRHRASTSRARPSPGPYRHGLPPPCCALVLRDASPCRCSHQAAGLRRPRARSTVPVAKDPTPKGMMRRLRTTPPWSPISSQAARPS